MRDEDERAYAQYVHRRVLALQRTAYHLCGDWHEAHDLAQAVLIRLYRHWPRVSAADSPDAYVRKMLVNVFLDQRRGWWARHVRPFGDTEQATPDRFHPLEAVQLVGKTTHSRVFRASSRVHNELHCCDLASWIGATSETDVCEYFVDI